MSEQLMESDLPYHMDVAKAMFLEHARQISLDAEQAEVAWMLEETVRHYWFHLAAVAIDTLGKLHPGYEPEPAIWGLAQYLGNDVDPNVMAMGDYESALDYGALLLVTDPDAHLFMAAFDADGVIIT